MEKLKKCLIIYNPISGKGVSEKLLNAYRQILSERGYQVDFVATKYKGHATKVMETSENYDVVFSIGGDGTLNEVVKGNYLREERLKLCPLPCGTTNDVATMLGYGKDPIKNLNMALDGESHNVDIGTINDTPFAYVVGMGEFMHIPYETSTEAKRKNGGLAYLKDGAIALFNKIKRYRAEVIIDGVKLDGEYSLIMVSNADHIAGINHFYKEVCLDDNEMEILLCKAKSKRELIMSFLKFLIGKKSNEIISLKARDISIKLLDKPDKNWCIDGEMLEEEPEQYNIRIKDKMEFLTPQVRTRKLFVEDKK